MADRFDGRLAVRPASDRSLSEMNQPEKSNVDPLFELARIVSGRGANSAAAVARRPAMAPAAPAPGPDVLGDLEAELMNDLQASFQAVNDVVPPKAPPLRAVPPPEPPTAQVAKAPEGVVRERLTDALAALAPVMKLDHTLGTSMAVAGAAQQTAPRAAAPQADGSDFDGSAANGVAPNGPDNVQPMMGAATSRRLRDALNALSQPAPLQPAPTAEAAFARAPEADRAQLRAVPPSPAPLSAGGPAQVESASLSERVAPRVGAPVDRIDLPNLSLRATQTADLRPRPAHSRWEKPAEVAKPAAASRFAPPKVAETAVPLAVDDEDEELFARGQPFANDLPPLPEAEAGLDEFELPASFVEDEVQPDPDFAGYARRRSRRRIVAFLVTVAVVLVGGAAFVMTRGGADGGLLPTLITAPAITNKVGAPPAPATDLAKNVDRAPDASGTTLVAPPTKVASIPPAETGKTSDIAKLIDPQATGASGAAGDVPDALLNEPKRVRTVTFDKDGKPISTTPGDAVVTALTPSAPVSTPTPAPTPAPVAPAPTTSVANLPSPTTGPVAPRVVTPTPVPPVTPAPRPSNNETLNVAGAGAGNGPNGELVITTNPGLVGTTTVPVAPQPKPPVTPAPAPTVAPVNIGSVGSVTPTPKPVQPPISPSTQVAQNAPSTSLPQGQSPAPTPTVAGGTMVQVSSQKNEEGARATFKELQIRYPKILGGYEVNVQRADLGDRGVFYRARVGPFSSADAKRLCDDLKAAGGDCVVSPG